MTRRQTLTAALSPLFAPLLAWLPGRRERKTVEPVPQWTGFVSDEPDVLTYDGRWELPDASEHRGSPYYTFEADGVTPGVLVKVALYQSDPDA